ncbi:MAG: hypothetical protein JST00_45225 [Deltaproteobacteria bacterium]|nr:hypothetical protein [Deltaproteobacteria bacterium]
MHLLRTSVASAALLALVACGGGAPPPVPTTPSKPVATTPPPAPVDTSPVPEPEGLVLVGRVTKPEAILKVVGSWTRIPLPSPSELVRSISDDAIGDAVDATQPVDGAMVLGGTKRDPKPLVALSIAVKSLDEAKTKIGARHKLTEGKNGSFIVEGIGKPNLGEERGRRGREEEEDDGETCALAPASSGARLVCGEKDALEALLPYLTRTVPRQTWSSDVHVELRAAPMRESLQQIRAALPFLARSLLGSGAPALRELVDASVGEIVDFVNDTDRMTLDATLAESGAIANLKVDYSKTTSLIAKLATSKPDLAGAPPPGFLHLPAETDLGLYGKGSDPKLFDRPKEILGKLALETTAEMGMPEPERKAVRDLVVDRMMALFAGGPLVYGKGYDAQALEKAIAARAKVKPNDLAAEDDAERAVAEEIVGWHLVQVSEPIAKTGPVLKDWAGLWNRPAFAAWAKKQASAKMLAQMKVTPVPGGVTLPKETVHLEIVLPRPDLEEPGAPPPKPARPGDKPAPPKPGKKIPRKPIVVHVFAVPDAGGSWIGFGLDGKLVAQKAAQSLSSAPDTSTLGKAAAGEAFRDIKANGAWLATMKGLFVFTAYERSQRSPYGVLGSLPNKGATPIVLSFTAQAPSEKAPAGSALTTLKLSRPVIEDFVKFLFMPH